MVLILEPWSLKLIGSGVVEEIIARVGPEQNIEFVLHRAHERKLVSHMTPQDATYLARGILACATALCGTNPPEAGMILADVPITVTKWVTRHSGNNELLLILTVQSALI